MEKTRGKVGRYRTRLSAPPKILRKGDGGDPQQKTLKKEAV